MDYTKVTYHSGLLARERFLVTGGAGFIGSHIVQYLLTHGAGHVRVLDNLSTGKKENIEPFLQHENFEFIEGDITDLSTCERAVQGMNRVSHQAALGSVPRSIAHPVASHAANVTGMIHMLAASKDAGVKRFAYASSSSVYGDHPQLPKVEEEVGTPLSPYAWTKKMDEQYAYAFAKAYDFKSIGLRYFNVYGERQRPDGPYAAVIPLFMQALKEDRSPTIHGDGGQTRDFTYVANAVQANVRAMFASNEACDEVYNVACGARISVLELWDILAGHAGKDLKPKHTDPRAGDVRNSLANVSKAERLLGYRDLIHMDAGLAQTWKNFAHES